MPADEAPKIIDFREAKTRREEHHKAVDVALEIGLMEQKISSFLSTGNPQLFLTEVPEHAVILKMMRDKQEAPTNNPSVKYPIRFMISPQHALEIVSVAIKQLADGHKNDWSFVEDGSPEEGDLTLVLENKDLTIDQARASMPIFGFADASTESHEGAEPTNVIKSPTLVLNRLLSANYPKIALTIFYDDAHKAEEAFFIVDWEQKSNQGSPQNTTNSIISFPPQE